MYRWTQEEYGQPLCHLPGPYGSKRIGSYSFLGYMYKIGKSITKVNQKFVLCDN
jgi:hypothetical protein